VDEATLLARCRDGDDAAWAELYRAWAPQAARFLRRLLGPTPEMEDLVQQVFVRLFDALPRFRGDATLATWVYGIAANVADRHRRCRFRWLRRGEAWAMWIAGLPPGDGDVPGAADARAALRVIASAVETLDFDHRTVWVLREWEGLSSAQVADALGVPVGTVRSRLFHARRAVTAALVGGGTAVSRVEPEAGR